LSIPNNRIGTYRTGYVLESLLAQIRELDRDFAANLIAGRRRDTDATGFGYSLKPSRDVDAIPENVVTLDQDVTEVDPHPVQHTLVLGDILVALGHHSLHSHGALDRIDYRGKLKQHAVPCGLDKTAPVLCYESVSDRAVFAQRAGGADLVEAHEPRVTGNVSRDYRC
jgi:hypothetical protein